VINEQVPKYKKAKTDYSIKQIPALKHMEGTPAKKVRRVSDKAVARKAGHRFI
jgi:hypothetical protein